MGLPFCRMTAEAFVQHGGTLRHLAALAERGVFNRQLQQDAIPLEHGRPRIDVEACADHPRCLSATRRADARMRPKVPSATSIETTFFSGACVPN